MKDAFMIVPWVVAVIQYLRKGPGLSELLGLVFEPLHGDFSAFKGVYRDIPDIFARKLHYYICTDVS